MKIEGDQAIKAITVAVQTEKRELRTRITELESQISTLTTERDEARKDEDETYTRGFQDGSKEFDRLIQELTTSLASEREAREKAEDSMGKIDVILGAVESPEMGDGWTWDEALERIREVVDEYRED